MTVNTLADYRYLSRLKWAAVELNRPDMSRDDKKLASICRQLDPPSRESLLAFAEFLLSRMQTRKAEAGRQHILSPVHEPAVNNESVIAAMKRLKRSYKMLDTDSLFNDASALMSDHVMNGRPAASVISELEALFERYYQQYRASFELEK